MRTLSDAMRNNLTPEVQAKMEFLLSIRNEGAKYVEGLDQIKAEYKSECGFVWAQANGEGIVTELLIDDQALVIYDHLDLGRVIIEVMTGAAGRGVVLGMAVPDPQYSPAPINE